MDEPNVLLLDEPTNDLDIDTLTALEDLLDGWPGTLVVVSHDRYFVQRVCDDVYALMGDGAIRHLPGGIEQYLDLRRADEAALESAQASAAAAVAASAPPSGAVLRAARKEVGRLERALDKLSAREAQLHEEMAAAATDHDRLRALDDELRAVVAEREQVEAAWLEQSELLEG
jgi:ATP-binding cassette subfamily F protein uup